MKSISKKASYNYGGARSAYDGVLAAAPRFGAPTLSPRIEDYAEIFGSRFATSIPVLDLPAADLSEARASFPGSHFDYREVFGGPGVPDFVVFEELAERAEGSACDSSDEAWTPAQSETMSDESEPFATNVEFHPSSDGIKKFKVSYNKVFHASENDMTNVVAHVTQLNDVPGYSVLFNEPPTPRMVVTNNLKHEDFSGEPGEGKRLKKTTSCPNKPFVTVSDVSLRTRPLHLPPPSRPPPILSSKCGDSGTQSSKMKASRSFAFGETTSDDDSPLFYDVEVDASSSAAVSAAEMKDVMEKAQAKLKSAKHMKERSKQADICGETSERDFHEVKGFADNARNHEKGYGLLHESSNRNEGNVEWKQDEKFYEVVETDDFRNSFDVVDIQKLVTQNAHNYDHGQEKTASKTTLQQKDVNWKMKSDNEILEKIIVEAVEDEDFENMAKVRKKEYGDDKRYENDFDLEENGMGLRGNVESERYDKRLKETTESAEIEKRSKEILEQEEKEKKQREAWESEEKKKREKEAREREIEEKVLRDATEKEENERKMRLVLEEKEEKKRKAWEGEEKEKRGYADCARELREATEKEENEKRLRLAFEEKEKEEREARERTEREEREEEAHERELVEKRLREAMEKEENEKRLILALEEKEKEQREARERKEREEREKEARERELVQKRIREAVEKEENEKRLRLALEEKEKEQREAREKKKREERVKEAREREEREEMEKEARERELVQKRLREAVEKEENEKRLRLALEEKEKEQREALEKKKREGREKDAREREEREKREKETREREVQEKIFQKVLEEKENKQKEREEKEKWEKEARERKCEEKRLREAMEKEENEKRLRLAVEEKEKEQREAWERKEREEKEKEAREREEREKKEKREKDVREREVEEKRFQKALEEKEKKQKEREERVKREKEAPERELEEKRLKEAIEQEENEKKLKIALEKEENEKRQKLARQQDQADKRLKDDLRWQSTEEQPGCTPRKGENAENVEKRCECEEDALVQEVHDGEDNEKRSKEAVDDDEIDKMWDEDYRLDENVTFCGAASAVNKSNGEAKKTEGSYVRDLSSSGVARDGLQHKKSKIRVSEVKESLHMHDTVFEFEMKPSRKTSNFVKPNVVNYDLRNRVVDAKIVQVCKDKKENLTFAQEVKGKVQNQNAERKGKNLDVSLIREEKEREETMNREKDLENEHLRKIEEEREREREREKDRMAVDMASLEKAAVDRATADARQRALAESRERSEKANAEARLRAERVAVERATAEARERAFQKAKADSATVETRERVERMRQSSLRPDSFRGARSTNGTTNPYSSVHSGVEVESTQRCKARLERHERTSQRAAKALEEKNMRDLLAQRELAERNRLAEGLDTEVKRWSSGKEGNLRALLSTLQYILGPDSGWQPIPLTDVITSAAVKRAYRKATLCVHPDKLQQRGASIHQKYVCEKVFDLLKAAWNKFNSEEH